MMIRTTLASLAIAIALAVGSTVTLADDSAQQAPAAAPADKAAAGSEKAGGCMPNGGCCGNGACAQAATSAGDPSSGKAAAGCPCGKMKKAQQGTDKPS